MKSMLAVVVVAASGCSRDVPRSPTNDGPVAAIESAPVSGGAGAGYRAAGVVRAVQRAELATRMMARIETIRVRSGDPVRAGQVLATFEKGGVAAAGAQAGAGLELATTNLRRMERLYADSAIPVAQLEAARAAFSQAKGHVDAASAELGYTALTAPFSGLVVARNGDPGDLASPGRPILVIEGTGAREIVVSVPEEVAAGVRPGQLIPVRVGAMERLVTAKVLAVVGSADLSSHSVEVRLGAPRELLPNLTAVAEFPARQEGAGELTVPQSAVVVRGELSGVYLFAADSTVRLRWVRLGRQVGTSVAVVSGLQRGDQVVAHPARVTDGQRARPAGTAP